MFIFQIVPRLPPAIDGLGDYSFNLARQLRKDFGITTHFLVGDPTWAGNHEIEGFLISQVTEHSANTLLSLLPSGKSTVLLHYVGYGYATRGCPFWLVDGLQRWRTASANHNLVTMFHELYASGLPWTSAFWLSLWQRNLVARLARLSKYVITNTQQYAKIIGELSRGTHTQIFTLPVFSNIGEPEHIIPLSERSRRMIVFGGYSKRVRIYQKYLTELSHACDLLKIEEIWDIGPSTILLLSKVNSIPIVKMGQQSASEISKVLSNSLAGFFVSRPEFIAKSGIFAAYCAHGILPVSYSCTRGLPANGIELKKHYWIPERQAMEFNQISQVQKIVEYAYMWYHTHNLSIQTKQIAQLLMISPLNRL